MLADMDFHGFLRDVLVIYISCLLAVEALMFPFGASVGDTFIPANDDGSSAEIFISTIFPYFDDNHNSLYVNTNGVISFLGGVGQYTPDPFPLGDSRRFIAPFWGDVDTRRGGTNSYREIIRSIETEGLFVESDAIVRRSLVEDVSFRAIWMFVATWDQVGYFGSSSPHNVNTFQAVLVTNGTHSFTIYNYESIQWTTGTASDGDALTGLGGVPAQAGFNAGDGVRFYSIRGSRTAAIVNIETTSNVNTPGRWVFRVDEAQIEGHACNEIRIVTRAEWGARPAKFVRNLPTPVPYAFVHHTAGRFCDSIAECSAVMRGLQNYHMNSNGWSDIGYSFLVGEDGNIYEGRGWNRVGGHISGYNYNGLAWSFIGSFMTRLPNQAALTAGRKAIECGLDLGKLTASYTLRGHRDVRATLCPGDQLYEEIQNWPHY